MKINFLSRTFSTKGLQTRPGVTMSMPTLIAIYSLAIIISLPGLAVSPILEDIQKAFPKVSDFELQMLESLPSLVIIPFILLSGRLSLHMPIRRLVIAGLAIFALSSIVYLMPIGIGIMLANSALIGVGAGMIIPFTTGLIAHYFTGTVRTQQLGIVSAISNLSLVIATAAAGILANVNWRLSFLVYTVSIISLILAFRMAKTKKTKKERKEALEVSQNSFSFSAIKKEWPISLMIFYFVMTVIVMPIPMNLSLFMSHYDIGSNTLSGILISVFFLSITLPGFFINKLISKTKDVNNLIWIGFTMIGIIAIMMHSLWSISLGVVLVGLGYGVIQPLIYDRTAEGTSVAKVSFNLALVMAMNYLAIVLFPFMQKSMKFVVGNDVQTPMLISLALGISYWCYYLIKMRKK